MTSFNMSCPIRSHSLPEIERVPFLYRHVVATLSLFSTSLVLRKCEMTKRALPRASSPASSHSPTIEHPRKRRREGGTSQLTPPFNPTYTASVEDAARVDADPPLNRLLKTASTGLKIVERTEAVVHWMRMADLRSECPRLTCLIPQLTCDCSYRQSCTVASFEPGTRGRRSPDRLVRYQPTGLRCTRSRSQKDRLCVAEFEVHKGTRVGADLYAAGSNFVSLCSVRSKS